MATNQTDLRSDAGPAFVSYCRADADFVLRLAGDLKAGEHSTIGRSDFAQNRSALRSIAK